MTDNQIREKLAIVLGMMQQKAVQMGIHGVAVASFLDTGKTVEWIGEMAVVEMTHNREKGWDLVAVAWSKCGEVIAFEGDSGSPDRERMKGEMGYVGGTYAAYNGCKLAFAFSGALPEQDLEVAKYGIEEMKKLI